MAAIISVFVLVAGVSVGCNTDDGAENGNGEDDEDFFEEVSGDVGVFVQAVDPDEGFGTNVSGNDSPIVVFCYEESGCEDRGNDPGYYGGGTDQKHYVRASDPDQTVVGVVANMKVGDEAIEDARVTVEEGTHNPEESSTVDKFDIETTLYETDVHTAGEVISFELGQTE